MDRTVHFCQPAIDLINPLGLFKQRLLFLMQPLEIQYTVIELHSDDINSQNLLFSGWEEEEEELLQSSVFASWYLLETCTSPVRPQDGALIYLILIACASAKPIMTNVEVEVKHISDI